MFIDLRAQMSSFGRYRVVTLSGGHRIRGFKVGGLKPQIGLKT